MFAGSWALRFSSFFIFFVSLSQVTWNKAMSVHVIPNGKVTCYFLILVTYDWQPLLQIDVMHYDSKPFLHNAGPWALLLFI